MTRTPRVNHLRRIANDLRNRVPAGLSRKTAAYVGAGLAVAGMAGTSVAAGLGGATASAASLHHVSRTVVRHPAARTRTAVRRGGPARTVARGKNADQSKKAAPARVATAKKAAPAKKGAPAKKAAPAKRHRQNWSTVRKIVARRTDQKQTHGPLPAHDQLTPVAKTGPQSYMQITPARYQNAKTIVRQAIDRHMGLRSAVIAVATSMQESTLLNLKYGTSDSLGLFQQRPSCGWGSAAQIENPTYAAGAFLRALHGYQAQNPDWAHQPLWQAAQGVQASGFPTAYAKWEAQAANLVASASKQLV
jgi:hypothetical protein